MKNVVRTVSERGRLELLPEDIGSPGLRETLGTLASPRLAWASGGYIVVVCSVYGKLLPR